MSMKEPALSNPEDEQVKVPCAGHCAARTFHKVLARATTSECDEDVQDSSQYEIIQCLGCRTISFRSDWQTTEDIDVDDDGHQFFASHEELFPSRLEGSKSIRDFHLLPRKVARVYKETLDALAARLPVLAGIGIRALVEAVCTDKGANGGNLEKRIDDLVRLGSLTPDGAEILHGTRLLGNRAAHEVEPLTTDILNAAMGVAEHLLQTVYLMPERARVLPRRLPRAVPSSTLSAVRHTSSASQVNPPPSPAAPQQNVAVPDSVSEPAAAESEAHKGFRGPG